MNREELEEQIDDLQTQISDLTDQIDEYNDDIDSFDVAEHLDEDVYDERLNQDGPVDIGGIEFDVSYVLKELDPCAYQTGFVNYCDGYDRELLTEYTDLVTDRDELIDERDDLEADLDSYQADLDELDEDEDE